MEQSSININLVYIRQSDTGMAHICR